MVDKTAWRIEVARQLVWRLLGLVALIPLTLGIGIAVLILGPQDHYKRYR